MFLHELAVKEFPNDPETMEQYALFLDFDLHMPKEAKKYYEVSFPDSVL